MTREKEISIAASKYIEDNSMPDGEVAISDHKDSFIEGADWADTHPILQWISVKDDLPCNHSNLVLTYKGIHFSTKIVLAMTDIHTLFLCEMKKDDACGWIWNIPTKDKITYWMPIPELPK